MKTVIILTKC